VSWEGGNPLSLYLKVKWGQVGNFPKVLGVLMMYFIFYEMLAEGGVGGGGGTPLF
jgi:hypothetical protein